MKTVQDGMAYKLLLITLRVMLVDRQKGRSILCCYFIFRDNMMPGVRQEPRRNKIANVITIWKNVFSKRKTLVEAQVNVAEFHRK